LEYNENFSGGQMDSKMDMISVLNLILPIILCSSICSILIQSL